MSLYNKIKKWFNGDEEVKVIPRPGDTFYIDNKPTTLDILMAALYQIFT